jgi:hypothetical protein
MKRLYLLSENMYLPWQNVVVFVSQKPVTNPAVFNEIHKRGAMCMEGALLAMMPLILKAR